MDTPETAGQALHSDDATARQEAARMLGKARTDRKIAAARAVAESRRRENLSEEDRAKLRAAQQARRERERLEREQAGMVDTVAKKRPPGRPRTRPAEEGPKRPRGRPRKAQEGEQA